MKGKLRPKAFPVKVMVWPMVAGPSGSLRSAWTSAHSDQRSHCTRFSQTSSRGAATTAAGQTVRPIVCSSAQCVRCNFSGRVYCFPCSAPLDLLSSCPMRVSHIRFQRPQTSRTLDAMMVNCQVPRTVNSTDLQKPPCWGQSTSICGPKEKLACKNGSPSLLMMQISRCIQHASTQQIELRTAIADALDHFQSIHLSFELAIRPRLF